MNQKIARERGAITPRQFGWLVPLVIVGLVVVSWLFVKPAPPSEIHFTAGSPGGAYHAFGERYAKLLARDGVKVIVAPSQGSTENLARLTASDGPHSVGFAQSGIATEEQREALITLGNVFYEPVWVFYRSDRPLTLITELRGKKINIGAEGSGTRALALKLLEMNGVPTTGPALFDRPLADAAELLERGEIDAMIQVAAVEAPVVARLMKSKDVRLMSLDQADAYVRRLPAITKVTLPFGVIDPSSNLPPRDVVTVASLATLVAREDLHPAIAYLLVRAARELHSGPGILNSSREFPSIKGPQEFEVQEDIERLYASGTPFLYRHLPFWLANLLMRLWVLVIPLAAVLVSATDWLPKLLGWRGNQQINGIYRDALRLEAETAAGSLNDDWSGFETRLIDLQDRVNRVRLPSSLTKTKYEVRSHLELVAQTLSRRRATPAPSQ